MMHRRSRLLAGIGAGLAGARALPGQTGDPDDFADIRGPAELPLLPPWAGWSLAACALLLLALVLWLAFRPRRRGAAGPRRPAPWPEARAALDKARACLADDPRQAVDQLAVATPTLLSRTGWLPAGAWTSDEWLPALQAHERIGSGDRSLLADLARRWDAIRFAGMPVAADEVETMVRDLEPVLERLAAGPPAAIEPASEERPA